MRSRRLINASHGRKFTDIRLTASECGGTQARQKLFPPSIASWVRRKHDATIEGRAPWAIPWPCVHEFLAVATHPRIYDPLTSLPKALDQDPSICSGSGDRYSVSSARSVMYW